MAGFEKREPDSRVRPLGHDRACKRIDPRADRDCLLDNLAAEPFHEIKMHVKGRRTGPVWEDAVEPEDIAGLQCGLPAAERIRKSFPGEIMGLRTRAIASLTEGR